MSECVCVCNVRSLPTSCSYTGLFGRRVHIGQDGEGRGDQRGVVVGDRRSHVGGEAADLGDPLLHAAGRQASLGVVVPALLRRLADLSQALWAEQQKRRR